MKDFFIFHRSFYCGTTRLGILQSGESEMYFIKAHTKLIHISTDNAYIYFIEKKGAQGQMRQKSLEFWHIFNTGKIWCMQKGKRIVKGIKSIILKSESPRS